MTDLNKDLCTELLALDEKRTPGDWGIDFAGNVCAHNKKYQVALIVSTDQDGDFIASAPQLAAQIKAALAKIEESAVEHAAMLSEYQREIEKCHELAQRLDVANPEHAGAFTGTPSERIARQSRAALARLNEAERLIKTYGLNEDGCRCSFSQRTVGDGCEVCNPMLALDCAEYAHQ
jgi:hypothetical protein